MNSEEFSKKSKEELKKFAEKSKSAFEKVGGNIQKFTDDSVVKIERGKLERKRSSQYEQLGMKLSALLLNGAKLQWDNQSDIDEINDIQTEIGVLTAKIIEKDELLNK